LKNANNQEEQEMKLNNLKPAVGSTHNTKRLGRGQGSGRGGTSTRGTKGAQARAGYEHKIGFEGGQMPIQRRVPKFGFKNPTRVEYQAVNVASLAALAEKIGKTEIGLDEIKLAGLAGTKDLVKVLGNGDITVALTVTADAFSASAVSKIEAAGGKAIVIGE
jgi:ribosomal protein L15, bacterial/organelle